MPPKIAVTIDEASGLVPFSPDYLRKAIHRTEGNTLPARLAARRYVIQIKDLEEWSEHEGELA